MTHSKMKMTILTLTTLTTFSQLPSSSHVALMLLLFEMGDKSVPPPLQVRCKSVPKNGRERGLGKEEHRRYVHIKNSYLR